MSLRLCAEFSIGEQCIRWKGTTLIPVRLQTWNEPAGTAGLAICLRSWATVPANDQEVPLDALLQVRPYGTHCSRSQRHGNTPLASSTLVGRTATRIDNYSAKWAFAVTLGIDLAVFSQDHVNDATFVRGHGRHGDRFERPSWPSD